MDGFSSIDDPSSVADSQSPAPSPRPRLFLAGTLLLLTFVTSTILGASYLLECRTDYYAPDDWLSFETVRVILKTPLYLKMGLQFSVPALFILLCHEFGHYLLCRRYRLAASLPYFKPSPVLLGTFGAFIRIRGCIRRKCELFDIGVAGPIAGFAALLPILGLGIAWSEPTPIAVASSQQLSGASLVLPGHSLLATGLIHLIHGPLPPGTVLNLHPFALAGWLGAFATMLNLLPLGQLDGGHILYAVAGRAQRRLAWPLWIGLAAVGTFYWLGWLFWCAVTLVLGLRHPAVLDEEVPLDPSRRRIAWLVLLIFLLCFMPVPLAEVALAN